MRTETEMSRLVQINVAFYKLLLPVFPPDLRIEFQEAMIRTFEEQLELARHNGSRSGALSVWAEVARDVVTIALPYRATWALLPAVTLLGSSGIFYLLLWGITPNRHC
jgi:hypothetical protein